MELLTVGHGRASIEGFLEIVRGAGVAAIADIRRFPGSRRHPQFGRDAMVGWLGDAGIGYQWFEGLGGRRSASSDSRHVGLVNAQFRAYADHMASAEFADALAELRALATATPVAVMCSEAVWWRCHRRLLADRLVLVDGDQVRHLFHDGRAVAHPVTAVARREGDAVVYDVPTRSVEQPA